MKLETLHMGTIDVPADKVVEFPRGLFGYPGNTRYALIELKDQSPIHWLQAVDNRDLGFAVLEPSLFHENYEFEVPDEERELLGLEEGAVPTVWVIIGIPDDPTELTANLKGPLVINTTLGIGVQLVLPGDHSPRYRIVEALTKNDKTQEV